MSKKLIKSGMIFSVMTLISRVLGLVRDMVIAKFIGASSEADVFFFANKIPNFFRRLFAEGAFAQAFVPVLSECHSLDESEDKQKTRQLIAQVSGTFGVIISAVTLFAMIASPLFAAIFGFGWFIEWYQDGPEADKFDLASSLLKITFPYLWFISLTALSGSILNTYGKFAVAAFTPVLLNVCIILMAVYGLEYFDNPAYALAWGVFLGGFVQFAFQLPFLYRSGALVRPKWAWNAPGVTKVRKLIVPALFGVSVTQINLLLDTLIASFLVTGSISWLYYADRLLEFPLGIFGIGIATVILPSLSKLHTKKNHQEFSATIDWGLRVVSLFGIPALLGLMALAKPIIMILFMGGAFDEQTVDRVSLALYAYLSGLVSFMFIKIFAPGFYARQDTKTPVKIGIIAMVANMVFNLIFAYFYGYVGLAIATTLSATLNAVLLYRGLRQKGVYSLSKETLWFMLRLVIAGSAMLALILTLSPAFDIWLSWNVWHQILMLATYILSGAACYFVVAIILGIRLSHFKVQAQNN